MDRLLAALWRLVKAAVVVAAAVTALVAVSRWRARPPRPPQPPSWPPLPPEPAAEVVATPAAEAVPEPAAEPIVEVTVEQDPVAGPIGADEPSEAPVVVWVLPKDGDCPEGYPVKAKVASGIYHLPGMSMYARTSPDRCYASGADAEADGFRPAKR